MVTKQDDKKELWNMIRSIRTDFVKKNADIQCLGGTFLSENDIKSNMEKCAQGLEIDNNSLDDKNNDLSEQEIFIGAEMFIALNSCPVHIVKLYHKAIYNSPLSKVVLLSLNLAKKAEKDFKYKAVKIFAKIISLVGFQHIYQNVTINGGNELIKQITDLSGKLNWKLIKLIEEHP